ncbi:hypothetical protein BHM03_00012295, partial [Ensete ventricosum]
EFARRRPRHTARFSGVAGKLAGNDVVGSRQSSLGDSPKGWGSSLETHREIAGRRPEDSPKNAGGYWIGDS